MNNSSNTNDNSYTDYSKKENQIGCGYCALEKVCHERDPKINKAKHGCKNWIHYLDSEKQSNQRL